MKKKFSRIMGVALTVALLASLFGFAAPVAAQPGEGAWAIQTIPTATNNVLVNASDVADIDVASDGTIYVINNDRANVGAALAYPAGTVLKSTDGGNSFTALAAITTAANGDFLNSVAVAPDDSSAVAVSDNATVYTSNNSGTTWTALPAKTATGEIMDLDVSPAIAGAIVARHYVIAIADPIQAAVANGEAEIYGPAATWTTIGLGAGDYMACKFSPSYVGDRAVALVWNAGGGVTNLSIVSQPGATAQATIRTSAIGTTSTDYDSLNNGHQAGNGQVACDIALPSNWDSSMAAGEITYVSVATSVAAIGAGAVAGRGGVTASTTGHATDDVYRIDSGVAVDLNGSNMVPVHSIAYSGNIDDGTLFLGTRLAPNVRYTLNPTSMAPTWKTNQKAPTGDNIAAPEACTKIVVAPDGNLYVGTRDSWTDAGFAANRRSAFSVSTDAGVTFDQIAMIDTGVATTGVIDDVMLTPDGGTIFMATNDATDLSLWTSSTPTESTTWKRIYCRGALPAPAVVGPSIVRLGADFADNPSIFWADTGAIILWVSHDGGAVFNNRTPPAIIQDLTVESGGGSGVIYMASGTNMYKSTNGGYFFGLAEPGLANAIISLSMAPSYPAMPVVGNVLVGGTGAVSYSTDSAATFTAVTAGLAATSTLIVCADEAYATNNMIYAGDSLLAGTANTFRYKIGTSSQFDDMISAAVATVDEVLGMGINNGVLYSLSAGAYGVERTLYPLDTLGLIVWDTGATTLAGPGALTLAANPNILTVADNTLYFPDRSAAPVLWALQDTTATVTPVINVPADGSTITIDPISGWGLLTTVTWDAMGSGGGLVNRYGLEAAETTAGWIGTTQAGAVGTAVGEPTLPSLTVGSAVTAVATGSQPTWATNQVYMLRVRARSVVNNPAGVGGLRSHWSDVITVYIQAGTPVVAPQVGPVLQGPLSGSTDVAVNPGFSWTPLAGATEYEFTLALDAGLTLTVEDTPVYVTTPSWQVPPGTLEYDTTYFWGVKASQPTESPQSVGTFRTMSVDVYACPFCTETFGSMGALDSHIAAIHPSATPAYIWAIIVIGAVLMIAVIMLIVKTRRVV